MSIVDRFLCLLFTQHAIRTNPDLVAGYLPGIGVGLFVSSIAVTIISPVGWLNLFVSFLFILLAISARRRIFLLSWKLKEASIRSCAGDEGYKQAAVLGVPSSKG